MKEKQIYEVVKLGNEIAMIRLLHSDKRKKLIEISLDKIRFITYNKLYCVLK